MTSEPASVAQPAVVGASAPSLDSLFDRLLAEIVGGRYAPGQHLPPERELSRLLGASRPTLREALRRLGAWRLVEARRGSGVTVRPLRDWSFDVLPTYLRLRAERPGPELLRLVVDLLALRRSLMVEVLRVAAPRLGPGALAPARAAAARAWEARADRAAFVRFDLEVLRAIVEAAGLLPALWLLNGVANVYLELAGALSSVITPAADYVAVNEAVLLDLEAGRVDAGCERLARYLADHDARLVAALGGGLVPGGQAP